jgi:hypothetical protein
VQVDLLRYVGGPLPYSSWWLWIGLILLVLVTLWYVTVLIWTLPSHRLRRIPLVRLLHARVLRHRFIRTIRTIDKRLHTGDLEPAEAGAHMSRTLRSFLHQTTGTRAQYMHVDAIANSDVAAAAPLLSALNEAQFNPGSRVDVGRIGSAAEELIRTWT